MRITRGQLKQIVVQEARRLREGSPFNDDDRPELIEFVQEMTDPIFDSLQSHGLLPSWAQDEGNEQDVREAIQVALEGMVDEIANMS